MAVRKEEKRRNKEKRLKNTDSSGDLSFRKLENESEFNSGHLLTCLFVGFGDSPLRDLVAVHLRVFV